MRTIINYARFCELLQWILIIIKNSEFFLHIKNYLYNSYRKKYFIFFMNSIKICLNCGSSDLVSDRSLGGKMVCFKCGSSSFRNKSFSPLGNKKIIYFVIALIVLLIVVI